MRQRSATGIAKLRLGGILMLARRAGTRSRHDRSNRGGARPCGVKRLSFYGCDKAIAPPMHRFNEVLALTAITQRATHSPQALGEGGFTHCLVRPQLFEQFFLEDHAVAMLHKVDQDIEPLGFKRTQGAPPAELITLRIELVIFKDINHISVPLPDSG